MSFAEGAFNATAASMVSVAHLNFNAKPRPSTAAEGGVTRIRVTSSIDGKVSDAVRGAVSMTTYGRRRVVPALSRRNVVTSHA